MDTKAPELFFLGATDAGHGMGVTLPLSWQHWLQERGGAGREGGLPASFLRVAAGEDSRAFRPRLCGRTCLVGGELPLVPHPLALILTLGPVLTAARQQKTQMPRKKAVSAVPSPTAPPAPHP